MAFSSFERPVTLFIIETLFSPSASESSFSLLVKIDTTAIWVPGGSNVTKLKRTLCKPSLSPSKVGWCEVVSVFPPPQKSVTVNSFVFSSPCPGLLSRSGSVVLRHVDPSQVIFPYFRLTGSSPGFITPCLYEMCSDLCTIVGPF